MMLSLCSTAVAEGNAGLMECAEDNADPMDYVEISLLTCEPHDEVYSLYGHSALRVTDRLAGTDIAVNWGVFDFRADYFVLRFVFGMTDYMMGICDYQAFLSEYRYYGAAVHQQKIDMTSAEKRKLMQLLGENAKPENVVYRYNFFYNNCTTRARDVILEAMQRKVEFAPRTDEPQSLRNLIHSKNADHPWARFGNDILLGVGCDRKATQQEEEFLPEMLMRHFAEARIALPDGSTKPLVSSTSTPLASGESFMQEGYGVLQDAPRPLYCALLWLALAVVGTIWRRRWLAFIVLLPHSVIGMVLTAMLFSQHPTVNFNLQILVCNPFVLWFSLPRTRFKWRWHCILLLCALFFAGNAMQEYAEGMNIMALAMMLTAAAQLVQEKKRKQAG